MAQPTDTERRHIDWPATPGDPCAFPLMDTPEDHAADALIDWIEDCEVPARFIPDWGDESIRNAA